jgi:23S rRNA (uracil1939-C5)-methyltransferase
MLVRRAMTLLAAQAGERIADMFCGLGNFTLPIARSGARVLGLEGSAALVARAKQNAELNGLKVDFGEADLFAVNADTLLQLGRFDKWLVDPPRDGALELVKAITPETAPDRIVYVSCNPATLARDAAVLVQAQGYRLTAAGAVNMFPHTAHVESIAVLDKG